MDEVINKIFSFCKETILKDLHMVVLEASYSSHRSDILGENKFYKIIIYVDNIMKTKGDVMNTLLFTIVHECFHTIQPINEFKYTKDEKYRKNIECNVDYSSALFINKHREELQQLLRFNVYPLDPHMIIKSYGIYDLVYNVQNREESYCLFHKVVSLFFMLPDITIYNLYIKNKNINIVIKRGKEKNIFSILRDGDIDKNVLNNLLGILYEGYPKDIEKCTLSYKRNELNLSVYFK